MLHASQLKKYYIAFSETISLCRPNVKYTHTERTCYVISIAVALAEGINNRRMANDMAKIVGEKQWV